MAGNRTAEQKFLAPAYFQVLRPKISPKKDESASKKLLPPTEYNLVKEKDALSAGTVAEINKLQNENDQLKLQLDKSKERELRLEAEIRQKRLLLQKERVDDALDFKRMAELQEENLSVQSEVRKLGNLNTKLKTDLKEMKSNFETDLERNETELDKANSLIKELKSELRQKEEIFEHELESLEKRSRKQVAVIKHLKAEVKNAEEQVKIDRKGFEDVISKNEFDKYEQVKALEKRLSTCELKHSQELQELRDEISRRQQIHLEVSNKLTVTGNELKRVKDELKAKEQEHTTVIGEYQEKLQNSKLEFDKTLEELNCKIEELRILNIKEVENLTAKLVKKDEELKSQTSTVDQLRAYIGENLPNVQIENLQNEIEEAREHLANLLQENERLRSTVELLNVRLSSVNEILLIQESELLKFQSKFVRDPGDQEDSLLTKWREKVFALLVQLKSQQILHEKEERSGHAQVKHLMRELEECQKEAAMLTHALTDKKAEHQIEVNRNLALEGQLEKSQQNEKKLESLVVDFQSSIAGLNEVAQRMESFVGHVGTQMENAFRKLAVLSQRINFASGRVQFLQGLLTHREAQLRNELSEALLISKDDNSPQSVLAENDVIEPEQELSDYQQLASEVKQLTAERDYLLAQARKESESLERKETVIKAQFEEQLQELANKISQLDLLLKDERERSAILNEKLQTAEAELSERLESIEALKLEMAKHKDVADKNLDKALQAEQARFTEEFAKLEKQFNDVRREHTKTVVTLRQAERQVEREREKHSEQLSLQRKEYEMKLEKSQLQVRHLEKERNMLMATVRQEGFKVPRLRPKEYSEAEKDDEKENRQTDVHGKRPIKTSRRKGKQLISGKSDTRTTTSSDQNQARQSSQGSVSEEMNLMEMTSMLKDLHSLSTALLTVDKENGDDSQQSL